MLGASWLAVAAVEAAEKDAQTSQPQRAASGGDAAFEQHFKPFVAMYCIGCHGPDKQKGERRFDRLTEELAKGGMADDNTLVDLQDMLDQLNLGEMPPPKAKQPPDQERRRAIGWLTARVEQIRRQRKPASGETVLRRLNAREYGNTLRDLLHLDMTMFDPTAGFPRDRTVEHLDNVGEALVTSGYLMQRYLAAADRVIEKIMALAEKPDVRTWRFDKNFRQQPEIDKVHGAVNGFEHLTLYDVVGADKHEGAYGPLLAFKEGVPYDGVYEIRFQAEAVNRRHPYDLDFVGTDLEEPLRLGIVPGNISAGPLHKPQPIEPLLAEMDLADEPKWYTVRVWLDAGFSPRFTFRNGLMDARNMWGRIVKKYPEQFPRSKTRGIVENRFNAIKYGKLPQIHIHEVEIEGPLYATWPTPAAKVLLGDDWEAAHRSGSLSESQMRTHLKRFASQAYRRPARDDEVDRLLQIVAIRRQAGRSPLEAYGDALKGALCSPSFLYLEEPGERELSAYALASRLSYFLWSSMPDERLLELAQNGTLSRGDVLAAEVQRMLDDLRSDAFVDGFLDSWLSLRDLGSMPPDRSKFNDYYRYDLQTAMREETRLFTRHLLQKNLGVENFLAADFTFVNKPLARHYGIAPPAGHGFERVSLDDRRRGGLLGQASVLTVTANGIDTSPVVRGVWLLDNLLGARPAPPPPDVEPLDPDIRGAKTIREQLEKHRNVASCYDCHRKIDPLGFALENFDAIGGWRDTYGGRTKIDAAGALPNGQAFEGIAELKSILSQRRDQFSTALTEKLLAYAIGRPLEGADRAQVERIVQQLAEKHYGFRDLIHLVAESEAFRAK
jgi:hypothetical protein